MARQLGGNFGKIKGDRERVQLLLVAFLFDLEIYCCAEAEEVFSPHCALGVAAPIVSQVKMQDEGNGRRVLIPEGEAIVSCGVYFLVAKVGKPLEYRTGVKFRREFAKECHLEEGIILRGSEVADEVRQGK